MRGLLFVLYAHVVGSAVVRWLPRRVWYALADLLLPLVLLGWPGQVRRASVNMRRILGPGASDRDVTRRTAIAFKNYARYTIDLLWLSRSTREEREAVCDVEGWEQVPAAIERGRGLVIVTGHFGNWDLPAAILAGRGFPVNTIVETLEPPAWNARVQAIRERIGIHAIPMETGARQLYEALKRNETVAIVFDRPLASGGVPVTYFGAETRLPEGVARLALRTGATVVGAVGLRRGDRVIAKVSPPFEIERTGDRDRDAQLLTQQMVSWLEGLVRQHPGQWFMFRDFWPKS
ncbi:MAG: lysophospholipid acyltransferase family protein [Chloroflexota bacterium]